MSCHSKLSSTVDVVVEVRYGTILPYHTTTIHTNPGQKAAIQHPYYFGRPQNNLSTMKQFITFAGGIFLLSVWHHVHAEDDIFVVGWTDSMNNHLYQIDLENVIREPPHVELVHWGTIGMPPLSFLQDIDTLIISTDGNSRGVNKEALGGAIAALYEKGLCVIVTMQSHTSPPLAGEWIDKGYRCILPTQNTRLTMERKKLDTNFDVPDSPLLEGVSSFDAMFTAENFMVADNCTVVARYEDGTPLIVVGGERRIDLNFYPVSSEARSINFYDASTDGGKILKNAVKWCSASKADGSTQDGDAAPDGDATTHNEF